MDKRSRLAAPVATAEKRSFLPIATTPLFGEEAKDFARSLADATPSRNRQAYAQAFCAAAVARYWTKLHSRRGGEMRDAPTTKAIDREAQKLATSIGDTAAGLAVDEAAYFIGSTYAAMLPPDYRSVHGVFYTPPAVVRRLLDAATEAGVDWTTCRVLDPACGGGAFLGPVAERMIRALAGCEARVIARNIATRLRGYEIDAFAAWMSQVFLEATMHQYIDGRWTDFDAIDVCDSLTKTDGGEFDLVIGNPPYGRITLSPEQRATYRRSLFGHANLYGVFLDLALRKAKPDGVIAYVTPTSFLSGEYFKRLRALLAEEASPASLDFVAEREGVFDDVLQETMLAVYLRGCRLRTPAVHFVETVRGGIEARQAGKVPLPTDGEAPWLLPRTPESARLAARLRAMPDRLRDWGYRVSTGPLVWNRFKDQLRQRPTAGTVPLIWAEAVSADGTFSFRAARRNHAPYFSVGCSDEWMLVKRSCVLLQRTTSKEQPRRLIAAELPGPFLDEHGAVTVENHLNMLVPIVARPSVSPNALAAFLNSGAADRAFRCISGSVAVSAYELEALPLPSSEALQQLEALLEKSTSREAIEQKCSRLYGAA